MLMWLELLKGANNVLIALPLKTQWVAFTLLVSSSNTQPTSQFNSTCNNRCHSLCSILLIIATTLTSTTWVFWVIHQLGWYELYTNLGVMSLYTNFGLLNTRERHTHTHNNSLLAAERGCSFCLQKGRCRAKD